MKKAVIMGDSAMDSITGFTGYVTGIVNYITGPTEYLLQPECEGATDNYPEPEWFDEGRIVFNHERDPIVQEKMNKDNS